MKKLVIAVFIAALFVATACEGPSKPEFKQMKNVKVTNVSASKVTLIADAELYNPNVFSVQLTGVNLDVSVNKKNAGKVMQTHNIEVPAQKNFSVPVKIDVALKDLSNDLFGTLLNIAGNRAIDVHYKGYVSIKALEIEIDVPIDAEEQVPLKL